MVAFNQDLAFDSDVVEREPVVTAERCILPCDESSIEAGYHPHPCEQAQFIPDGRIQAARFIEFITTEVSIDQVHVGIKVCVDETKLNP